LSISRLSECGPTQKTGTRASHDVPSIPLDKVTSRLGLDNLQMSDVVFTPYDSHRGVRPLINECFFSGWLRSGKLLGKHLPEWVLRQFGHVQGIPRDPAVSATPGLGHSMID
jgi:hypothetical protein